MANINRRLFVKSMGAASFASSIGALSGLNGLTASATGNANYKAIVCIFLDGGMDHADTLLPYDTFSYNQLAGHRPNILSTQRSSRLRENLLELNPEDTDNMEGRKFALPKELSEIHELFEAGDAAIVSSVGPLIEPVTRSTMEAGKAYLPARLYSHNDQAATWVSLNSEGISQYGWGGRFADAILQKRPHENPLFSAISTDSNPLFLSGELSRQFRTSLIGPTLPRILRENPAPGEFVGIGNSQGDRRAREIMREYLEKSTTSKTNLFQRDFVSMMSNAIPSTEEFSLALEQAAPIASQVPVGNRLAEDLSAVAQAINIQQYLGNTRQVFFVRLSGFDTHANQSERLPTLHRQLSSAIASFRDALLSIGMWGSTTVFTASEFGRTVVENGDGTDHGWAGHQFVFGGSVSGKRIYGKLPNYNIASENYTRYRGRLIPGYSVEQFASTLGLWFGLSMSELSAIFPNLDRFNHPSIGFLAN